MNSGAKENQQLLSLMKAQNADHNQNRTSATTVANDNAFPNSLHMNDVEVLRLCKGCRASVKLPRNYKYKSCPRCRESAKQKYKKKNKTINKNHYDSSAEPASRKEEEGSIITSFMPGENVRQFSKFDEFLDAMFYDYEKSLGNHEPTESKIVHESTVMELILPDDKSKVETYEILSDYSNSIIEKINYLQPEGNFYKFIKTSKTTFKKYISTFQQNLNCFQDIKTIKRDITKEVKLKRKINPLLKKSYSCDSKLSISCSSKSGLVKIIYFHVNHAAPVKSFQHQQERQIQNSSHIHQHQKIKLNSEDSRSPVSNDTTDYWEHALPEMARSSTQQPSHQSLRINSSQSANVTGSYDRGDMMVSRTSDAELDPALTQETSQLPTQMNINMNTNMEVSEMKILLNDIDRYISNFDGSFERNSYHGQDKIQRAKRLLSEAHTILQSEMSKRVRKD